MTPRPPSLRVRRASLLFGTAAALVAAAATVMVAQQPGQPVAASLESDPPVPAYATKKVPDVPRFAEDVAPILVRNCTVCHHVGGPGPMPLFEYDTAVSYKKELRKKVGGYHMPPWGAVGARGVFRNDRRLYDNERATILRWLDTGMKPGDLKKLPPRPDYPSKWGIGEPDVIISMAQEFKVPARGKVDYQYFEVPTNFTEDKWIQAYEILPGERKVVHHVQVYAKAPPEAPGAPAARRPLIRNPKYLPPLPTEPTTFAKLAAWFRSAKDTTAQTPEKKKDRGTLIASMAPGTNPVEFPAGTALLIKKGTVITFVMHYTAKGHAMHDRTRIGFRFAKAPPQEQIFAEAFTNQTFTIPAGQKDVAVPSEVGTRETIKVWGLLPHTHLRGARWLYKIARANGTQETLLDIPGYDFNWQIYYLFKHPVELRPGDKILSTAWYDNSADNEDNPDPTQNVKWGEQTWEEMQYTGILYSIPGRKVEVASTAGAKGR